MLGLPDGAAQTKKVAGTAAASGHPACPDQQE